MQASSRIQLPPLSVPRSDLAGELARSPYFALFLSFPSPNIATALLLYPYVGLMRPSVSRWTAGSSTHVYLKAVTCAVQFHCADGGASSS